MSLQTFFIRGAGAAAAAGILGCGALALVLPSHDVVPLVQPPASQKQANAAPAPAAAPPPPAAAPHAPRMAAPSAGRSAGADPASLPPSAPSTAATVVVPVPRPAQRGTSQASLTAPTPPTHTHVHHAASKPPVAGSTSRHKTERLARASTNATVSVEPRPVRPPGPPSPYVTYDTDVRSPYEVQPWYYRRLY